MPSSNARNQGCSCLFRLARKRLNPQPLISHLTNSNGCGNLQVKVLLTVSPFRPSFIQPLVVHPANDRFLTPLFSITSELLFSQLLCFHNYLRCPLLFSATHKFQVFRPSQRAKCRLAITTFRMNTCKSVSKQRTLTPFRMNTYAKTGGRGCYR